MYVWNGILIVGSKTKHPNRNAGIGVDVHVHRIANRLGWVNTAKGTPEDTRKVR